MLHALKQAIETEQEPRAGRGSAAISSSTLKTDASSSFSTTLSWPPASRSPVCSRRATTIRWRFRARSRPMSSLFHVPAAKTKPSSRSRALWTRLLPRESTLAGNAQARAVDAHGYPATPSDDRGSTRQSPDSASPRALCVNWGDTHVLLAPTTSLPAGTTSSHAEFIQARGQTSPSAFLAPSFSPTFP